MERTVIIGASFGGLEFLYRTLRHRRKRFAEGEMTVIEPRRQHAYIPLTHEVVSGAQRAEDLLFDTEQFCQAVGARFVPFRATAIDRAERTVQVSNGTTIPYDRLIIATGSVPDIPLAMPGGELLFAAKFLDDAVRLRARILALRAARNDTVHALVIGAGITGVEWSTELAGRGVNGAKLDVTLVTRDARILSEFSPNIARHAARVLKKTGVHLRLSESVATVGSGQVITSQGVPIPCDVVIWAAGVRSAPLVADVGLSLTPAGHLAVNPHLASRDDPRITALGDAVRVIGRSGEWPTAVRAIEAIWQGAYAARRSAKPYRLHPPFFYGLSLGPGRSMLIYRRWWLDLPVFVWFRRFLRWAYYLRFRLATRFLRRA